MKIIFLFWASICLRWARWHQEMSWTDASIMTDACCKHHIDRKWLWYARYDAAMAKADDRVMARAELADQPDFVMSTQPHPDGPITLGMLLREAGTGSDEPRNSA